jgi:hypothetical protein
LRADPAYVASAASAEWAALQRAGTDENSNLKNLFKNGEYFAFIRVYPVADNSLSRIALSILH